MGGVEDCEGGGQAGEPHALPDMSATDDVSNPDTSWLKALAPLNTTKKHSQAQPCVHEISISTEPLMPNVRVRDARTQKKSNPAS